MFVVVSKYPFSFGAVEPELVVFVFAPSANKEYPSQSGCASFKSLTIFNSEIQTYSSFWVENVILKDVGLHVNCWEELNFSDLIKYCTKIL